MNDDGTDHDHASATGDSGREAQPDHAEHAAESGEQADRLGQHRRPAGDDQGMEHHGGDVGREEPYDEEPMVGDGSTA